MGAEQAAGLRLQLEQVLPAPPERAFAACVDPEQLRHWWGPAGFTVTSLQLDAAEGAHYRIAMQPPEGDVFHVRGTFRVIQPRTDSSTRSPTKSPIPTTARRSSR